MEGSLGHLPTVKKSVQGNRKTCKEMIERFSPMKHNDYLYLPLSFEYLMTFLFGKLNYHGYVGSVGKTTWKKDMQKIIKYIKKTILLNVHSDNYHKSKLMRICDELTEKIKKSKRIEEVNILIIQEFTRLIFNLLGNMPDHWRRRQPYKDLYWTFDGHRSLCYTQNTAQKVGLILSLEFHGEIDIALEEYNSLNEVLGFKFRNDKDKFLSWFKKNYPSQYCDMF